MFIGRTAEMSELNRLYGTGSFEMPVIYGRRRVGKTRLITEFIQGKKDTCRLGWCCRRVVS